MLAQEKTIKAIDTYARGNGWVWHVHLVNKGLGDQSPNMLYICLDHVGHNSRQRVLWR